MEQALRCRGLLVLSEAERALQEEQRGTEAFLAARTIARSLLARDPINFEFQQLAAKCAAE
ncbi:MAG: hypothetical protein HZB38_07355 [Planctomycetes bacterium]|nr:hypothetical protein [Planctomycetota bacterium]